jgi:hypothetical protein
MRKEHRRYYRDSKKFFFVFVEKISFYMRLSIFPAASHFWKEFTLGKSCEQIKHPQSFLYIDSIPQ